MICPNCGILVPDNAAFCPECRTQFAQQGGYGSPAPMYGSPDPMYDTQYTGYAPKNNVVKKIVIAVVAVIAVIAIAFGGVYAYNNIGGRSYEELVDEYMQNTVEEPDGEKALDLFPEQMLTYIEDEENLDRDDLADQFDKTFSSMYKTLNDSVDSWSVEYKIKKVKDAKSKDLKKIREACEDEMDMKVSDVKNLTLKLEIEYTKDGDTKSVDQNVELTVIKVGRDWYLFGFNGESMADYF